MIGSSESLFVAVLSTFGSALTSGKWKISSRKLYKTLERGQFTFHHRCLLSAWRGDGKENFRCGWYCRPRCTTVTLLYSRNSCYITFIIYLNKRQCYELAGKVAYGCERLPHTMVFWLVDVSSDLNSKLGTLYVILSGVRSQLFSWSTKYNGICFLPSEEAGLDVISWFEMGGECEPEEWRPHTERLGAVC